MSACALLRPLINNCPWSTLKKRRPSLWDQLSRRERGPECLEQRIAPATVTAGSIGSFFDSDGDAFTVKLTGPGSVEVVLDDPDNDDRGAIASLALSGTTTKSKLSVAVKKGGDREVAIGTMTGTADLGSFLAAKSDLIGAGLNVSGTIGSLKLGDVRNGADITLAGTVANKIRVTVGEIGDGSDLMFGATATNITATPVGTGEWSAPSFGKVATKGGGFGASILATAVFDSVLRRPPPPPEEVVGEKGQQDNGRAGAV